MRYLNKGAVVILGCFVLGIVLAGPQLLRGDEWNLTTKFSVNHPFEVPGMVLQPNTRYVIRLLDSPSSRNVVQIYNEDQTHLLTTFIAISDERLEPADRTVFTFIETQPEFPMPIKEWFYPGRLNGLEFVYPKDQAMEIARHAREPVLATASNDLHHLNTISVEAIRPKGTQAPITESAANVTKSENTAVVEEKPTVAEAPPIESKSVAEAPPIESKSIEPEPQAEPQNQIPQSEVKNEPEVQQEKPAETPAPTPAAKEEKRELPRTAGELPLMALIGVLCLGAGVGMRVLSTKS